MRRLISKIKSIFAGWRNSLLVRLNLVRPEVKVLFDARLSICSTCENLRLGICTLCGCPVKKKTKSLMEDCPDNRWPPFFYTKDGIDFIRYSEIPFGLREEFAKWFDKNQCVVIEIEGVDAINADYWDQFRAEMTGKVIKWGR